VQHVNDQPSSGRLGIVGWVRSPDNRWWVLLGLAIFATGVLAAWYAARGYFRFDEWSYWTFRRDLIEAGGLRNWGHFFFSPWGASSTSGAIPTSLMALWLPLDSLFGMHAYLPYALPSILFHLATAVLLVVVLRHIVERQVAAGAATVFVLLATAASVITSGWLVNFVAPVTAAYAGLALIERDGERGLVVVGSTLGLSLVALGFSPVGLVTALVIASSYALRMRFAVAAGHLAAVVVVFLAWQSVYEPPSFPISPAAFGDYLVYAWNGLTTALGDLVRLPQSIGALLLFAALGSVALAWTRDRRAFGIVGPTLLGSVALYGMLAVRGVEVDAASFTFDQHRYVYTAAALLLPALAWGVAQVARRGTWRRRAAAVVTVAVVAANVVVALPAYENAGNSDQNRVLIETAASLGDRIHELEGGILVTEGSARISADQFLRLQERGKVPCRVDLEAARAFAERQGLPGPEPLQPEC